jgi:hypothetical protein
MASLEAKIAESEATEPEEPEEETEEPETEETDAAGELAAEAVSAKPDTAEKSPDDDTHKAGLRQADYTRKTQALAEERKTLHAEIAKEREDFAAKEEEFAEVVEWLEGLKDPETMEFELQRYYPEAAAALRDKWILESQEESELTEKERVAIRRAKDLEVKLRAREQDEGRNKKVQQKRASAQKTAELRTTFMGWLSEVVGPAGLDDDEDTKQMIRERLIAGYGKQTWDKKTFAQAAADVAKRLKREPKAQAAPTDKLPPGPKGTGHKPPPTGNAPKKAPVKKHSEEYFRELRAKYGVQ